MRPWKDLQRIYRARKRAIVRRGSSACRALPYTQYHYSLIWVFRRSDYHWLKYGGYSISRQVLRPSDFVSSSLIEEWYGMGWPMDGTPLYYP